MVRTNGPQASPTPQQQSEEFNQQNLRPHGPSQAYQQPIQKQLSQKRQNTLHRQPSLQPSLEVFFFFKLFCS